MTPRQFHAILRRHAERLERDWMPHAAMMAVYANCHRDKEKRPEPFTPADFMPGAKRAANPQQTWQEQLAMVEALNMAFGGKDLRT